MDTDKIRFSPTESGRKMLLFLQGMLSGRNNSNIVLLAKPGEEILCVNRRLSAVKSAFTLVEMLVVLLIIGLVAAAIGSSLSSGIRTWDSAHSFGEYEMNAAVAFRILEKDLANMIPIKDIPFDGQPGRVKFPARVMPLAAGGEAGREPDRQPGTVEYYIDPEGKAFYRKTDLLVADQPGDVKGEVLARDLQSISFGYMVHSDGDEKDATWVETWNDSTNMPVSVRIEIRSADPARQPIRRIMNIQARPPAGDL